MSPPTPLNPLHPQPGLIPATHWTWVIEAQAGETRHAAAALEHLARAYWRPLYVFARHRGRDHPSAEDDVQGFFAHLLSRDFLRAVTPREGRFRTFLLTAFTRWLSDQRDHACRLKRGGGQAPLALEELHRAERLPISPEQTADVAFDRRWAREVFDQALQRVAADWRERAPLLAALRPLLAGEKPAESYAALGARLGLSESAVGKAAFDLRALFARRIREEIRMTVRDDAAVEDELRYLIRLLRQ